MIEATTTTTTTGLQHKECLQILHDQIDDVLFDFKNKKLRFGLILRSFFKQNVIEFLHNFLCISICSIFIFILNQDGDVFEYINATILLLISFFNTALLFYSHFKRTLVIYKNARIILKAIKDCVDSTENWSEKTFSSLSTPNTLSISCQWALREDSIVNLPLNLVVTGDHILLRPGHYINLNCRSAERNCKTGDYEYFKRGQKYDPSDKTDDNYEFLHRVPLKKKMPEPLKCIAEETPYVKHLKSTLENYESNNDLIIENETKSLHKLFLFIIIPLTVLFQIVITSAYHFIFTVKYPNIENRPCFFDALLTNLMYTLMPLLPVSFTCFWKFIKLYGVIKIYRIFKNFQQIQQYKQQKQQQLLRTSFLSCDATALLMQQIDDVNPFDTSADSDNDLKSFNFAAASKKQQAHNNTDSLKLDYSHSMDTLLHLTKLKFNIQDLLVDSWHVLKAIVLDKYNGYFNQNLAFVYSTNFFIGLGSLTNFSCVDKKGVLSWPNPTAENIWMFKSNGETVHSSSSHDLDEDQATTNASKNKEMMKLETFNLTNDKTDGFKLHFDDTNWLSSLNLLKPLGLSILLNTCNKQTVDYYLKFSDLLKLEADKDHKIRRAARELFPLKSISDRRCLCEISHLMNFEDNALNCYEVMAINSLYRDTMTNTVIRQHSNIQRPQIPISNLMSVIAYYKHSGIHNMYCQGTADLVIDFCTDYWDGKEIKKLSYNQRKKLLDIFQRNSVASYCTAFSYKPVIEHEEKYLLEASKRFSSYSLKCPIVSNSIFSRNVYDDSLESLDSIDFHETLSVDGIADDNPYGDFDLENTDDSKLSEHLVELHSNQIFTGMVSMQYKPKLEVIKLVEKLTKACIRFVHFSSDNEQVSRVFGEALGLDAGWNCHISLAEDAASSGKSSSKSSRTEVNTTKGSAACEQRFPSFSLKQLKKPLSLPNLKTTLLYDQQTQTVKFDLSNIKPKEEDGVDEEGIARSNRYRDNIAAAAAGEDFERKKLFDEESSSHQTGHSGHTLSDTDIIGNAARLPKGVGTIRQHIENVDNVPLHVSLFTDCEKPSIKEMIKILRDYGEIVCCFGSANSIDNIELFTEANLAVAIEPLYPQLCMKESVVQDRNKVNSKYSRLCPIDLSSSMNTLNCGLCLKHDNLTILPHAMSNARELVFSYYVCLTFMLLCNLSLCGMQLLGSLLYLPPLFSEFQLLWLLVVIIPALSFSLINKNHSEDHIRCSTKKNNNEIDKEELQAFVVKFLTKFLPTVLLMILMYCFTLYFKCKTESVKLSKMGSNFTNGSIVECHKFLIDYLLILNKTSNIYQSYWSNVDSVHFSQNLNHFFVTFYFILISMNYVYIEKSLWNLMPFKNILWTITIILVLFVQMVFTIIDLYQIPNFSLYLRSIPIVLWVIYFPIWPIVVILFNEQIKVFEIKTILRKYKKIRLEFDTKLGMNSPFV